MPLNLSDLFELKRFQDSLKARGFFGHRGIPGQRGGSIGREAVAGGGGVAEKLAAAGIKPLGETPSAPTKEAPKVVKDSTGHPGAQQPMEVHILSDKSHVGVFQAGTGKFEVWKGKDQKGRQVGEIFANHSAPLPGAYNAYSMHTGGKKISLGTYQGRTNATMAIITDLQKPALPKPKP
jgi:hypothetical protein